MKLRFEKNIRVMTDIMGYCHLIGADDFHVDFTMRETLSEVRITCQVENLPQQRLDEMERMLSIPRQREVEQYYWSISGEEEIDDELSLAGMMTDRADIRYEDGTLTILVERYHHSAET